MDTYDFVITGGTLVSYRGEEAADIGVRGERIVAIAPPGSLAGAAPADATIDAAGLHVLPGVIDSQVHFREPGKEFKEDFESGSRGAVLGGVTCVFDMPNTTPSVLTPDILRDKLALVGRHSWTDFALYVGTDGGNIDVLPELERMPGVCGVKVFMGSSTTDLVVERDADLRRVLFAGRRPVAIHAEDEERINARRHIAEEAGNVSVHHLWRDEESAIMATKRVIGHARAAGRRIHILHVTTGDEIDIIAQNKDLVTCELLPQHLTFAAPDCYATHGALVQQNPPIREAHHRAALWRGLKSGIVDVVASDHGPHTRDDKAAPYPNFSSGMPGTQTLLPLLLDAVASGKLSLAHVVDLVCAGPARIFGMSGKGRIAVGNDADFTLVDLGRKVTIENAMIASKVGWTAYDGMTVQGWPVGTIIRGDVVMRDSALIGAPRGRPVRFVETFPAEATDDAAAGTALAGAAQ